MDAISPIKANRNPDSLAFVLVWRGLTRSLCEILREIEQLLDRCDPESLDDLLKDLTSPLDDMTFELNSESFLKPETMTIISNISSVFVDWLFRHDYKPLKPETIVKRLPAYFTWFMDCEIRSNSAVYAPLSDAWSTPFTAGPSLERSWLSRRYEARFRMARPVYGVETFNLDQMYVPLRASRLTQSAISKEFSEIGSGSPEARKKVVDPEVELINWYESGNKEDALRFLTGAPGSGVLTFGLNLSRRLLEKNGNRVLFIPVSDFEFVDDMDKAIYSFIRKNDLFNENPMNDASAEKPLLLIFSHLNDIGMPDPFFLEQSRRFLKSLLEFLDKWNRDGRRAAALATAWPVFVEDLADMLLPETLTYELLPLYIPEEERHKYDDPDGLLVEDQRIAWWNKFEDASGFPASEIRAAFDGASSEYQVTAASPMMQYLSVLAVRRGQCGWEDSNSFRLITESFFETIYDRTYDDRRPYRWLYPLDRTSFMTILEEISVMCWRLRQPEIGMVDLRARFERLGLVSQLEAMMEQVDIGVLGLFRLKRDDRGRPAAIRFSHDSFRELLVVRKIIDELRTLKSELDRRKETGSGGLVVETALLRWTEFFGPAPIHMDLSRLLTGQIRMEDREEVSDWRDMLARFMERAALNGLPIHRTIRPMQFREMTLWAWNAETALFILHAACAKITDTRSSIVWPTKKCAGDWIRTLQRQRFKPGDRPVLDCLCYLDFSGCRLDALNLVGVDLQSADLSVASLRLARAAGANLRGAILVQADLKDCDLRNAYLTRSVLRQARAREADLRGAVLKDCDLTKADLSNSRLKKAIMVGVNAQQACFAYADLEGADLRWADLRDADLTGACLKGADMREADLTGAELDGVDMEGANLKRAILNGNMG